MKRLLRLGALAVLGLTGKLAPAQVTVTPIVQPHQTFVDGSGSPCALCLLYTYVGGTTTPQPTFTDSTGTVQNQNPIQLDIAGGADIWTGVTYVYKFVLKEPDGTTVWSVDNVKGSGGAGGVPCSTAYAIQFANSSANALTCDPTITINPSSHSIQVGGVITGPSFTLSNLSTIVNSWTLDVTSPATAAASLAPIALADLANGAADTVVMNDTAGAAAPVSVALPSGCTLGINYSTSTHTWSCALTAVPLSSLAAQAADTVVMNDTSGSAAPVAVAMPSSCSYGVNYSTSTHTWTCLTTATRTCSGTSPPWSCYRISGDGTIEEWGVAGPASTGGDSATVAISFPYAFTSTGNLEINTNPSNCPTSGCSGNYVLSSNPISSTIATTGFSAYLGSGAPVGGGGSTISGSIYVHWHAIGN